MLIGNGLSGLGDAATWLGPIPFFIKFTNGRTGGTANQGGAPNAQLGDSYTVLVQAEHAGADIKLIIQDSNGNTISTAIVGQTDSTGQFTYSGQFNTLGTFVYNFFVGNTVNGGWYQLTSAMQLFPTVTATAPQQAYVSLSSQQEQALVNAAPAPNVAPPTPAPAAGAWPPPTATPSNPTVNAPSNPTTPSPTTATAVTSAIASATAGLPSYWPYALAGLGLLGLFMMERGE